PVRAPAQPPRRHGCAGGAASPATAPFPPGPMAGRECRSDGNVAGSWRSPAGKAAILPVARRAASRPIAWNAVFCVLLPADPPPVRHGSAICAILRRQSGSPSIRVPPAARTRLPAQAAASAPARGRFQGVAILIPVLHAHRYSGADIALARTPTP